MDPLLSPNDTTYEYLFAIKQGEQTVLQSRSNLPIP